MALFDFGPTPAAPRGRRTAKVQMVRPTFPADPTWRVPDELPELHGIVALDTENKDPGLSGGGGSSWCYSGVGFICGVSVAWSGGNFYLPVRHAGGNADPSRIFGWLREQARKPDVTFVYANCMYDLGWLSREGVNPVNAPIDVQGMAALLDEFKLSYSLDTLGREYIGRGKSSAAFKDTCARAGLVDPMANMDMVPAWVAAAYSTDDAVLTYDLYHALKPLLEAEKLTQVHELERECYLVGFDMKRQGVRVNTDKAARYLAEFEKKRDAALQSVYDATGVRCSASDNQSLARALKIENPNLALPKTSQGRDRLRKEEILALKSPVADLINAARRYDKACNTFFRGYLLESPVNGRIHADFNPLRRSGTDDESEGMRGAGTARWSSTNPNLTNIPNRDPEIGHAARDCFEAEEGEDWGKLDYSAQEPRLAVHFAERAKIKGAREMGDLYRKNPKFDMHAEVATGMNTKRGTAKTIGLGILYGAGGAEVCRRLGLPTEWITLRNGNTIEVAGPEGKELLERHFAKFPFIKGLQQAAKKAADQRGWVQSLLGRRMRFQKHGDEYARTHKACNSIIQPAAATMLKSAQIQLRREGITPLVAVHDECDVSLPRGSAGQVLVNRIRDVMESAVTLTVPVIADVKVGGNWAGVRDKD